MTLNSACAANEPLGAIAASLKAARPSLLCITVHCLAPLGAHLSHSCFLWLNLTTGSHSHVFVIATGLLSAFPASKLIQFITREQTLNWKSYSRAGEAAQLCGRSASVVISGDQFYSLACSRECKKIILRTPRIAKGVAHAICSPECKYELRGPQSTLKLPRTRWRLLLVLIVSLPGFISRFQEICRRWLNHGSIRRCESHSDKAVTGQFTKISGIGWFAAFFAYMYFNGVKAP
ncbi:hypothetical protein B0H13DRAFT_1878878 [Mycena leptocephala]|nr:hypothetical protein B0H13DRAFT_1878878 [Mycena leptocephala]